VAARRPARLQFLGTLKTLFNQRQIERKIAMRDDHAAACHGDGNTSIFTACKMCRGDFTIVVPTGNYLRWLGGVLVQTAFPMMPKEERELLISGTCDKCFKALFAVDLEEEDDADQAGDGAQQ
jgi:hypothetical protein